MHWARHTFRRVVPNRRWNVPLLAGSIAIPTAVALGVLPGFGTPAAPMSPFSCFFIAPALYVGSPLLRFAWRSFFSLGCAFIAPLIMMIAPLTGAGSCFFLLKKVRASIIDAMCVCLYECVYMQRVCVCVLQGLLCPSAQICVVGCS